MAAPEDSEWNDAQRLHNGQASVAEERASAQQEAEDEMHQLLQKIDDADKAVFLFALDGLTYRITLRFPEPDDQQFKQSGSTLSKVMMFADVFMIDEFKKEI